jgi:O-antigen/teichoic acid export membrane protein
VKNRKLTVCVTYMTDQPATMVAEATGEAVQPVFGSLVSGVAVTFTTRVVIVLCTLATSVIIAHWLGPEGTGALAVLNVTAALALQFGSAGIPSATTYFIAKDRRDADTVWINGLVFSLVVGIALAGALVAIANIRPSLFNGVSPRLVAIISISIPFQLITLLGLNLLLAVDRLRLMNYLDALSALLFFMNAIAVLVFWRGNLTNLVWFNVGAAVIASLVLVCFIARVLPSRNIRPQIALLKRMLVYGLKFYVCIFAGFIIFRIDVLIVNHFRGAEAAGVYSIASQFSFLLIMLPGVIASLLFPRVAARRDEPAAYAVDVTRHTSFIMLLVCVAAAVSSFALPLVYGARFADSKGLFLMLLPGVFFISLESVLVQYFTGTGLPVIIPWFWVITVIVNVGLNVALVPTFGARAAAVNSTVSYALIFFLVTAYFWRQTGQNPMWVLVPRVGEFRNLFAKLQRRAFAK